MADLPPPTIHADALPCLKRQQLENLCGRLNLRQTGSREDLIERLRSFAMGNSASVVSSMNVATMATDSTAQPQTTSIADMTDVIDAEMEEEDLFTEMMPSNSSIRILSKPRPSHFATAQASLEEMGVGVVMPSQSASHGSLGRLAALPPQLASLPSEQSNPRLLPTAPTPVLPSTRQFPGSKRILSSGSLTGAWKKIVGGQAESQTNATQQSAASSDMGLGLHASESHASVTSMTRKWLKGEGTASVTRPLTRSQSSSSVASQMPVEEPMMESVTAEEEPQQPAAPSVAGTPLSKRKRSSDGNGEEEAQDIVDTPASPEVPQRRIKPRPSRTPKRTSLTPRMGGVNVPTVSTTAQQRVWAEMQARMAASKATGGKRTASNGSTSSNGSQGSSRSGGPSLPASPLKSVSSRTRGRFSSQHDRQFELMDSIANHYAAVRRGEQEGTRQPSSSSAPPKRQRMADESAEAKVSYASASDQAAAVPRSDEERAAIRRKLDLARHRRKSNTNHGRTSHGTAVHTSPAAKLSSSIRKGALAQKITFAVRGIMGAASRGLQANSTLTPASATDAALNADKEVNSVRPTQLPSMGPPPPRQLQSSLQKTDRKPSPSSVVRPTGSRIPSPSERKEPKVAMTGHAASTPSDASTPVVEEGAATSPRSSGAATTPRKTRSSVSQAARGSLHSPRRSAASHAGRSSIAAPRRPSTTKAAGATARRPMPPPSLQMANQQIARDLMTARRSRLPSHSTSANQASATTEAAKAEVTVLRKTSSSTLNRSSISTATSYTNAPRPSGKLTVRSSVVPAAVEAKPRIRPSANASPVRSTRPVQRKISVQTLRANATSR